MVIPSLARCATSDRGETQDTPDTLQHAKQTTPSLLTETQETSLRHHRQDPRQKKDAADLIQPYRHIHGEFPRDKSRVLLVSRTTCPWHRPTSFNYWSGRPKLNSPAVNRRLTAHPPLSRFSSALSCSVHSTTHYENNGIPAVAAIHENVCVYIYSSKYSVQGPCFA